MNKTSYETVLLRGSERLLNVFIKTLDAIRDKGGKVDADTETILNNWRTYKAAPTLDDVDQALSEAVASTKTLTTNNLNRLYDAARITRVKATNNEITRKVAAATYQAAANTYRANSAEHNYQAAANAYNQAAAALTNAYQQVDVDLTAEEALNLPHDKQATYLQVPTLAATLNQAADYLYLTAALAGITNETGTPTKQEQISLTTNWRKAHRRRVWEAWDHTDTRAGRWAPLLHAGVTLQAPTLKGYEYFADLAAIETRQRPALDGIGIRQYKVDPEDEDYEKRTSK